MTHRFNGARKILLSPATTLEGLAAAVGLTAEELFHGTKFDGVDLTDESIEVLARIDADYSGAILSRRQRSILDAMPARVRQTRDEIADLRAEIMRQFIKENYHVEHRAAPTIALLNALRARTDTEKERSLVETRYAAMAVQFITAEPSRLLGSVSESLANLLRALTRAKMPIDHRVLDVWPKEPADTDFLLQPRQLMELLDLNLCTTKFVSRWLDRFEEMMGSVERPRLDSPAIATDFHESRPLTVAKATSAADEMRGEALLLAIRGPRRPLPAYLENVLGRARSGEELRDLAAAVPGSAIDQATASTLARMLAMGATTPRSIAATLADDRQHSRVSNAFRRLLISAGTSESRRLLLETIAQMGEGASGLEVDAVLAGLPFDEAMQILRPFWYRLTAHHQAIARTALLGKATSPSERSRVHRL